MDLLNLEESQCLIIEKQKYKIINKVKFTEKSSYWMEYKLRNLENNQMYYLNVELSLLAILYKITDEKNIKLDLNINYKGEEYKKFEKGYGKVNTYYGLTDVALNDISEYLEYKCKSDNKKILSVEKWRNQTEISIGKQIKIS